VAAGEGGGARGGGGGRAPGRRAWEGNWQLVMWRVCWGGMCSMDRGALHMVQHSVLVCAVTGGSCGGLCPSPYNNKLAPPSTPYHPSTPLDTRTLHPRHPNYNPHQVADMKEKRGAHACAADPAAGLLYVVGGYDVNHPTTEFMPAGAGGLGRGEGERGEAAAAGSGSRWRPDARCVGPGLLCALP
jgi:hypothetical protein